MVAAMVGTVGGGSCGRDSGRAVAAMVGTVGGGGYGRDSGRWQLRWP